ncbi:hypothetical protein Hanom_Chr08g00728001 [Helianthus anomalus]
MNNDPLVKKTVPNWKKSKQVDPDDALRFKRMRAELVAVGYGPTRLIARWSKLNVEETYINLEEHRKKDPLVSQKPVYPETTAGRPQQTHAFKKFSLSSDLPTNALNQLKRQKQTDEEDEHLDDVANQLTAQLAKTIKRLASRPHSPNSSQITLVPRKPSDPKIPKWNSSSDTHVLTLLRSDGNFERIIRKDAYGLSADDLQELLNLQLERDEEDTYYLDFELQFKGQILEMLMRK